MALTLKLNRNAVDMSLLDGDSGAQLDVGWTPRIARPAYGNIPPYVTEQIPIRITDSSQDNLAAEIQELHQMQAWAEEYRHSRSTQYPVWLYSQLTSETGGRRAFVRRIAGEFLDSWYGPQPINANPKLPMLLEVERHPYWEETAYSDAFTTATPSAAVSVTVDYTAGAGVGDVAGDVPARIFSLTLAPAESDVEIGRLWIGTRSAAKHGTLANFVNHWECEDASVGVILGTNAARATDATAHPGGAGDTKITITPGTATWAKRLTIPLDAITGNESDNFGNFLWLLRTQVSAGTWEVQLRWGYISMNDADHLRGPVVEVAETSWDIKEMGIAPVPLHDLQVVHPSSIGSLSYQVQVWARRTDGAGTLDLDVICPVPVDESWLVAKNFICDATTEYFTYSVSPNDRPWAGVYDGLAGPYGAWITLPTVSADPTCLGLPPGDGRFIIVYATALSSDITDAISVSGRRYDRWLSLRGTE